MKYIYKIFAVILVLLASVQGASAQKVFYLEPDATVDINDSIVIRLNDYVGTIQWQKSYDLQLWDNIPGATQDTLLFVADTTSCFRAEVIAGDCDPFYSDTTLVRVKEAGVTDIDGNFYPTVIIGNQEWMAENLRVTNDANGNPISRYCYNHEDNMCLLYGGLYTWHTTLNGAESSNSNPSNVQGICPTGWHVPSDAEWDEMVNYMITEGYPNEWYSPNGVGNVLKSCRQTSSPLGGDCDTSDHPYWIANETHFGTDAFGFSALPAAGRYSGDTYYNIGFYSEWWSSTISDDEYSTNSAWTRALYFDAGHVTRHSTHKGLGISVRCVRDMDNGSPTTYTLNLQVLPESSGQVSGEGEYIEGTTVTITATPNENYQFVNWTGDTDYIADASAASAILTMPATDVNFTANFATSGGNIQPGEGVTDIDGNFYPSVIIGNQEWMAENLKTTKFADGSEIDFGINIDSDENTTTPAYAIYNYPIDELTSDEILNMFGALYNWPAVNDPRGLCPAGWQVPGQIDWDQLISHLTSNYELHNDMYSSDVSGVGNALKSCRQVNSPLGGNCNTTQHPRWNANSAHYGNNLIGFNALPGGSISYLAHSTALESAWWWSATSESTDLAKAWYLFIETGALVNTSSSKINGLSVRCIKSE